jgi:hypothetical protein
MEITKFIHHHVSPDKLNTHGFIAISSETGGCGEKGCHCSDGHWISIGLPRTKNGVVQGLKVQFDSPEELKKFLEKRQTLTLK